MFNELAIYLVNKLMNKSLSYKQRNSLISTILDNLDALPIRGIISLSNDGQMTIGSRSLDLDQVKQLQESAKMALDNTALRIVNEQINYIAVVNGINKATLPEQMTFNKAAIWFGQEQERLLKILAQESEE